MEPLPGICAVTAFTRAKHTKAPRLRGFWSGYPSWIRTMNDRVRICNVTVTLRGSKACGASSMAWLAGRASRDVRRSAHFIFAKGLHVMSRHVTARRAMPCLCTPCRHAFRRPRCAASAGSLFSGVGRGGAVAHNGRGFWNRGPAVRACLCLGVPPGLVPALSLCCCSPCCFSPPPLR